MKTFTRLFTMLAVAAFVAAGCVNEEPPYKEEPKPTPGDATGFLSVSGLSMRVVYDETDVRPDDTSDQTQSPQAVSGTRAEQPDVDGFHRRNSRRRRRAGTKKNLCRTQTAARRADETSGGRLPHGGALGGEHSGRSVGAPGLRRDKQLHDFKGADDPARRGGLHIAEYQGHGGLFVRTGRHAGPTPARRPYRWARPVRSFSKPKRARPTSNRWTSRIRWISTSTAFSPTPTSPRSSASRSRESRPASGVRFRS